MSDLINSTELLSKIKQRRKDIETVGINYSETAYFELKWIEEYIIEKKANEENKEQDKALHLRGVSRCFSSESELRLHVETSIPIAIKPTRKSKTTFVYPFTSYKAKEAVVESIVEGLLNNG